MPFPNQRAGVGMVRPFRKITLDVNGVETAAPTSALFEWQEMTNSSPRLLITAPPDRPGLFRELCNCPAGPLFLLYILHTSRSEVISGRYQSPPLNEHEISDVLATFESYLSGDARHDTWVHSASDGRTLIWDRHDLIYAEGGPLDDILAVLEAHGFAACTVPRLGATPHIHYYRAEFDADAAALLARYDWSRTDLRPEDEQ